MTDPRQTGGTNTDPQLSGSTNGPGDLPLEDILSRDIPSGGLPLGDILLKSLPLGADGAPVFAAPWEGVGVRARGAPFRRGLFHVGRVGPPC